MIISIKSFFERKTLFVSKKNRKLHKKNIFLDPTLALTSPETAVRAQDMRQPHMRFDITRYGLFQS